MKKIIQLAKKFRVALERTPHNDLRTTLGCTKFPNACCDDASLLLAAYLSDNGLPGGIRVHGVNGGESKEIQSHVWIWWSGLIIDITADQFINYGLDSVLVESKSIFHETFDVSGEEFADFRLKFKDNLEWLLLFSNDYRVVMDNL